VALPKQSRKSITKALKMSLITTRSEEMDNLNVLSNMGISLNNTSNNEHVPEIERYIRTKECTRATHYHSNDWPLKSSFWQCKTAYSG